MFLKKNFESNQRHSHEKLSPSPHISCIIHHCLCLKRTFKYSCQLLYKKLSEVRCKGNTAVSPAHQISAHKPGGTTTAFV